MSFSINKEPVVARHAISAREPLVVCFDSLPPSVNALFGQAPGHKRYPSDAYKSWTTRTEWQLLTTAQRRVPGQVHLLFEFGENDRRQRDASNYIKACEDMLVKRGIIDGDHSAIVRHLEAKWTPGLVGVRVTITSMAVFRRAA